MNKYDSLSKEELIKLLLNSDEKISKLNEEVKSRDSRIEKLEAEVKALNIAKEDLIAKYEDKVTSSRLHLVEQYIPSSEKLKDEDLVINELEVIKTRRKRTTPTENILKDLKEAFNGIPIEIDFDFEGNDIDRTKVKPFGKDETYKIEYHPSSFEVVKYERLKYKDSDNIYETLSDDVFPHSPLTPSLAANLIEMKFNLGIPFYRYSAYLNNNGLKISDVDIYNYARKALDLLDPLYEQLLNDLVNTSFKVLHADETPLKVLDSDKEKCYVYVYSTSFWDKPIYIYSFNDSRSIDSTKEILKDYKGYLVCDGYAGYDSLTKQGITIQRCMVHARRYFNDCLKVLSEDQRNKSPAHKVITIMSELFKYEAEFRKKKLSAGKIKEERNSSYYLRVIDELNDYINSIDYTNNELLRKAVNYYLNHKKELFTYLDNGYLDMSNNLAERVVKPFVIARKNFLFCKTPDGAHTTAKLFSIVQTAKANGLKSEQYLTYVLSNINKIPIKDLLPYSDKIPKELKINN